MGAVRTVADTRVAQQWSPRNEQPAEQVRANSQDQGWWRCEEGHEWSARIAGRTSRASGCPYCSGRRRIAGVNDFATLHPDLARRWHPENTVDPSTVGPRSNRRVRWLCADGHEWTAPVSSLTAGHGCPFCARRTASAGINDLVTTHRDLVTEWDDAELAPTAVTSGSSRKAWWRCRTCAHRWQATVVSRAHSGTGCPRCGTRRAAEKRARPRPGHALTDAFPAVAAQWHPRKNRSSGTGCPTCRPPSRGEAELRAVLADLVPGVEIRANDRRTVPGFELDAYLPALGIALEYNGVYFHSELFRDRGAHAAKLRAANSAGIRLITVWEDDWLRRRDVVVRSVAAKLGVTAALAARPGVDPRAAQHWGARSLAAGEVDARTARAFLTANHLQGAVTCSRRFALTDDTGVVRALLALRSPRGGARAGRRAGEWEIVRYATLGTVPGGFSRLLACAERALADDVARWVTFADAMVSDGGLYERTGFAVDRLLAPDYRYAGARTGWVRMPKESFQRKRFRDDPELQWDESWTEAQAAARNGLVRVWDAGKTRYVREVVRG